MTEHVKILGWIYVIVNTAVLAVGLAICVGLALDGSPATTVQFATGLYVMFAITLIPGLVGGIGLLRSKAWGRIVLIVISALNLGLFPVGTVLGVYGLWVLLGNSARQRSSTPGAVPAGQSAAGLPVTGAGQQISRGAARMQESRGPLLLTMAGGAAAFLLIVGVGYFVSHPPFEVLKLNPGLRSAAVIALVLGAFFAWRAIAAFGRLRQRRTVSACAQAANDEWRRRIEELRADPARRKYAALIEQGEPWSDEQIAYDQDPTRTATCVHLQPIERTMRAAGIRVKRWTGPYVDTNCRVHPEELKRSFPGAPMSYREYFESERAGAQDFPMARIFCDQCRSAIGVIHPQEAKQETPWFPYSLIH